MRIVAAVVVFASLLPSDRAQQPPAGGSAAVRAPELHIPGRRRDRNMVAWDPAAAPRFPIYSVNYPSLRVTARAVEPEDWQAFAEYCREFKDLSRTLPGRIVFTRTYDVTAAANQTAETLVDLSPALRDGLGHVVLVVEPPSPRNNVPWDRFPVWIQVTRLAVDATVGNPNISAWTTSLETGAPVAGASVSAIPGGRPTPSGSDGLAWVEPPPHYTWAVVARAGSDSAFTTPDSDFWLWVPQEEEQRTRFYVFATRGVFRPGEEIPVKGLMRRIARHPRSTVRPFDGGLKTLNYALVDGVERVLADGRARVSGTGAFDFVVRVPRGASPGEAVINLWADDPAAYAFHSHAVEIQKFDTPPFEVTIAVPQAGPHLAAAGAPAVLDAASFDGHPLENAAVTWTLTAGEARYAPPGHDRFAFGDREASRSMTPPPTRTQQGRTDARGHAALRLEPLEPTAYPVFVEVRATVRDARGRTAETPTAVKALLHPAHLYVGLRAERWVVDAGEPIDVDAIATTIDGTVVAGRAIEMRAERLAVRDASGPRVVGVERCATTSAATPVRCTFRTGDGGLFRIVAAVRDAEGRTSATSFEMVAGGSYWREESPASEVVHEILKPIAGKREFRPGEVADLLVHTPFVPAEGLLTIRRRGLVHRQRFTLTRPSGIVRVVLERDWAPSVVAQIDLVGSAPRTANQGSGTVARRPAFASGVTRLFIPPAHAALAVETAHAPRARTGQSLPIAVTVRDAAGAVAAGAELTIAVVDEAVLFQTGYVLPDPLDVFYRHAARGGEDAPFRRDALLWRFDGPIPDIPKPAGPRFSDPLDDEFFDEWDEHPWRFGPATEQSLDAVPSPGGRQRSVRLRRDVNSLVAYAATVVTDAQGRASVDVKLPGAPSRYRIMVVAARGLEFGKSDSILTSDRR